MVRALLGKKCVYVQPRRVRVEASPIFACLKDTHKSLDSGFSKWSLRSPVQKSLKTRSLGSGLTLQWLLGSFGIALWAC